ncbi:MAG: ATP-dependent RecD-like DNA helicase [Actinobacteria bacterium]|nr:MAG: ATP-dependent RecD-like DNA helicase [Actinomycetota bacterium]
MVELEIEVTLSRSGPRYVSPDLEFAVWTATLGESDEGDAVTLAGPLGHVAAGDQLVCAGAYAEHARYGRQFAVESFRSSLPRSPEGVALWLRMRVPGIGPTFARAIVDHFGADRVFSELDRDPERLREVRTKAGRAVSRRSVERAIAAWREVASIREVETFLFAHGIAAGLAGRLVREYGDDVVDVLTHDPYRLIELPRVGFKTADRIARSLGAELDDPQRLRAGLRFALEEAEADGNVFLPLDELWPRAAKLLEIAEVEPLESAVRALVAEAEAVVEGDRIYRTELWETERRLARLLAARAHARGELFEEPRRPEMELSDEQWAVVELVRTRPLVLLTGLPGAGKTHTQRAIVEIARRGGARILLCAPTGKAARRMRDLTGHDAMTIHRALGYSPFEGGFQRDEDDQLSNDCELVIVDEASMLSLELADALFRAAGDCHVLLVGDTDQLPPIGAGRVLADLVESEVVPRVHLTAIYRQAARSLIVRSARRINAGEPPFLSPEDARAALGDVDLDEDFFFVSKQEQEAIRDAVIELVCERIPARYGLDARTDVMTLVPMRRGTVGLTALNDELERRLNPGNRPVVLARAGIRLGSRIVQTKNDYTPEREVMNGEVAFVVDWDEEEGEATLSLDDGEREIVVPASALETYVLAWALTVHRAQGSQFPAVVAPWSTAYAVMLSRPLLYTAVTRAERLCVVVGERRALLTAVARAEGRRRHSALAERIVDLS